MSEPNWWEYEQLESGEPYDWGGAARGDKEWDGIDYHLDLGCGTIPKGRLGIDRFYAPKVKLLIDLASLLPTPLALPPEAEDVARKTLNLYNARLLERYGSEDAVDAAAEKEGVAAVSSMLPFPDNSIESIISHHFFEHLHGEDAIKLIDECHRVLKPQGILRIIVPAWPSLSAVADLDHKSYWMPETFEQFLGAPDGSSWMESFSVPYTSSRFEKLEIDITAPSPPELRWTHDDRRELRAALRKW
jgi:SAM-dependent methyltransferase